jgi:hypothetical protein
MQSTLEDLAKISKLHFEIENLKKQLKYYVKLLDNAEIELKRSDEREI